MNRLTRVTAPVVDVLSLAEAKEHLRVDHNDEDTLIQSLIGAAVAWLDGWTGVLGMALEPQTWEMTLDRFPVGEFCIPLGPVTTVESVKYLDPEEVEQTLAAAEYETNGDRIRPVSGWPSISAAYGAVKVRFIAGTGTPESIKHVVRLLIGHWYENRESVGDKMEAVPMAVDMLISPIRRVRL